MDAADKISVLLVDDRPEKLLALEAILADLPLNLVRAYSGRDALRCLLQQEFAAILLDVNMPGMDGFDTAQLIRQRKSSEHTPIIFVTAYHDELFMSRGYSLGAVDYILQPVVPEILRSKVAVFVDLYRKNRIVREQALWQQQRATQLQKLASASVQINAAQSMARTLQIITDSARDVIGGHQAITLFILDNETQGSQSPKTRAFSSFSDKYADWRGRPLQLDAAATSVIATSRTASRLTAAQLPNHPDWALMMKMKGELPPIEGVLAAPLIGREGRTVGVIYLSDKVNGEFTADDEAILVQLAQMATVAIENILGSQAREANRAKDQFIAVLSHELRTPLTPVLALVAGLQGDKRLPNEIQEDLKIIRRNVELEARLIDDLLDLTRISKGKIELQLEVLDANELLREAANICKNDIAEKSIELVVKLDASCRFVKGDATRLHQVLWNLVKNAVKFTPAKGRITVESLDQGDSTFCACVTDTGIGIEPDILPRIFHAFEQGRTAITRQFGGLGLGLAISKALVEQHRGTLVAASAGRGQRHLHPYHAHHRRRAPRLGLPHPAPRRRRSPEGNPRPPRRRPPRHRPRHGQAPPLQLLPRRRRRQRHRGHELHQIQPLHDPRLRHRPARRLRHRPRPQRPGRPAHPRHRPLRLRHGTRHPPLQGSRLRRTPHQTPQLPAPHRRHRTPHGRGRIGARRFHRWMKTQNAKRKTQNHVPR